MAKKGRPFSDNPKIYPIYLRLNKDGDRMVTELSKSMCMSKSDTIRHIIEECYRNKKGE